MNKDITPEMEARLSRIEGQVKRVADLLTTLLSKIETIDARVSADQPRYITAAEQFAVGVQTLTAAVAHADELRDGLTASTGVIAENAEAWIRRVAEAMESARLLETVPGKATAARDSINYVVGITGALVDLVEKLDVAIREATRGAATAGPGGLPESIAQPSARERAIEAFNARARGA